MPYLKKLAFAIFFVVVLVKAQAQNGFEANYDEAKVPAYTLPDILKTTNNQPVKDKTTWEKVRRPEIIKLFEENVYGQMPTSYELMLSSGCYRKGKILPFHESCGTDPN